MNLNLPPCLMQPQPPRLPGLWGWDAGLSLMLAYGQYLVMVAGLGMLILGALQHKTGWIIPGGVLSGIGLGIVLSEGVWAIPMAMQSGLFLLCFALGWFLITLLSRFTTPKTQWWALVPGVIMAALGCAIILQDL